MTGSRHHRPCGPGDLFSAVIPVGNDRPSARVRPCACVCVSARARVCGWGVPMPAVVIVYGACVRPTEWHISHTAFPILSRPQADCPHGAGGGTHANYITRQSQVRTMSFLFLFFCFAIPFCYPLLLFVLGIGSVMQAGAARTTTTLTWRCPAYLRIDATLAYAGLRRSRPSYTPARPVLLCRAR